MAHSPARNRSPLPQLVSLRRLRRGHSAQPTAPASTMPMMLGGPWRSESFAEDLDSLLPAPCAGRARRTAASRQPTRWSALALAALPVLVALAGGLLLALPA